MEMAEKYGISDYSTPAGGCLLTDPMFSKRLKDLFEHSEDFKVRDIELLKTGRHIRLDEKTKIIVGRNESDNAAIQGLSEDEDIVITMKQFPGPTVLVPYGCDDKTFERAAAICVLYGNVPYGEEVIAGCKIGTTIKPISTTAAKREDVKDWII